MRNKVEKYVWLCIPTISQISLMEQLLRSSRDFAFLMRTSVRNSTKLLPVSFLKSLERYSSLILTFAATSARLHCL